MTNVQKLANALDLQQPDWMYKYADQQDLRDFAYEVNQKDVDRWRRGTEMLRNRVASKLFEVLRAATHAKLVTSNME